jgi:hypothetical protein
MKKYLILFILLIAVTVNAETVTVAWDANSETNLQGYRIYWGKISRYDPILDLAQRLEDAQQKACGSNESCRKSWEYYCKCDTMQWNKVYTDKEPRINFTVPTHNNIWGMNIIKTPSADNGIISDKDYMVFDINEAGLVYIAYDENASAPAWMSDEEASCMNFVERSGYRICLSDGSCFKMYQGNPGCDGVLKVNLGGNSNADVNNYFVLTRLTPTNLAGKFELTVADYDCVTVTTPPNPMCDRDYYAYENVVDPGDVLEYTITGLETGETYYLAAAAYNDETRKYWGESKFSTELIHVAGTDETIYLGQPKDFENKTPPKVE